MVKLIAVNIERHAQSLFQWRQQPDIHRFMYSKQPLVWQHHLAWLQSSQSNASRVDRIICWKSRPVGLVCITEIDRENLRAILGMYVADLSARVRGVGAAAEFLALDLAFSELNLEKISCEVFATNESVLPMHLQFGFVQEGLLRRHARFEGEWVDVHRLSILAGEWQTARPKLSELLKALIN